MNGGDIPLRAGWPQSAHRVPAMGPRPCWPLRPHSFPPVCSSWFCLVSSSTDPGHSLSVRVSGAHSQHPQVGIKKGSNPHSRLTPCEVGHCYLGLLPCNYRLAFLYPDFYVSHFLCSPIRRPFDHTAPRTLSVPLSRAGDWVGGQEPQDLRNRKQVFWRRWAKSGQKQEPKKPAGFWTRELGWGGAASAPYEKCSREAHEGQQTKNPWGCLLTGTLAPGSWLRSQDRCGRDAQPPGGPAAPYSLLRPLS